MTITIPRELEDRLKGEASRQGVDAATYAQRLIERGLPGPQPVRDNRASLAVLDQWERDTDTSDPAEIARRNEEFEQFKESMNRNRLESEGPDARKIYP